MAMLLMVLLLILSLVPRVVSQTPGFDPIIVPEPGSTLPAGVNFTVKWVPGSTSGTVSINLLAGASSSLMHYSGNIASKALFSD
jgi:hypothetical protein